MTADEWPLSVADDYGDTVISCHFPVQRASKFHPDMTWQAPCGYPLVTMAGDFSISGLRAALERHIALSHGSS